MVVQVKDGEQKIIADIQRQADWDLPWRASEYPDGKIDIRAILNRPAVFGNDDNMAYGFSTIIPHRSNPDLHPSLAGFNSPFLIGNFSLVRIDQLVLMLGGSCNPGTLATPVLPSPNPEGSLTNGTDVGIIPFGFKPRKARSGIESIFPVPSSTVLGNSLRLIRKNIEIKKGLQPDDPWWQANPNPTTRQVEAVDTFKEWRSSLRPNPSGNIDDPDITVWTRDNDTPRYQISEPEKLILNDRGEDEWEEGQQVLVPALSPAIKLLNGTSQVVINLRNIAVSVSAMQVFAAFVTSDVYYDTETDEYKLGDDV